MFALGRNVIQTGVQTEEGGCRHRKLGYCMAGAFFDCYEVVGVAKNSDNKKGEKKKRKGGKGKEEEGKNIPSYGISTASGVIIRSVHLGIQCN